MNATSCPDRETLTAYLRGTLAEDAAKAVDQHLPVCDQCNAVLAAIEGPDDEVVAALRESPSPNLFAAEPEYHRAVAELRDGCAAPVGAEPTQSFQPTTSAPFAPGDCLLGRYEIRRELGRGGMGVVYVAWDRELSREVAVKVPALDRLPSGFAETFLHEARTAAVLEHPGIIRIYDFGRHEGVAFAVMQYVDGPSLKESLASQPVSHARAVEIVVDIAEALQYAHKRGFIHRDLKPGNIFIDKEGKPHIADFGLAIHESEQESLAGSTSGTAAYMAPEQARGQTQWLDGRADLWALGVIFYEMLTHRRPFQAATPSELRDEILHREPKPPRMIDDSIPGTLEAICLKCLSKDVKDRFSSGRDLVKALHAGLRQSRTDSRLHPVRQRWHHWFSARMNIGPVGCAFSILSLMICVTFFPLLMSKPSAVVVPGTTPCPSPGATALRDASKPAPSPSPTPTPPAANPLLSRLSGAVLLIQVEKSGQFWPFAACCAVSENTVLTSAREALQIGAWTRDPKSGFKAWVTHPASGLKLPVREIRFYAVSVATEKPDDWMFTNLGLIAVQGDLPKTAELAGPDDSAQLAQGNTVHVLGYTHEGDLTTPADHFEVDETPARILFIATHRDLPGKPRRLAIKAELPKSALGSPVVNAQGKVVAVYCDPTAVAEAGADEKGKPPGTQNMHYATVINPGVIDLWVKKSDTSMWVSTTDLKLPAQSLAARDVLVPPNWGWGPWGWGHGGWHHGGTPLSYTIEARASLVAAQGEFLESVAIARRIHADAYALEIQNAVEEVKAYFERRRMNREIVLQEKGNWLDIIREKKQKAMETYVKRDLHDLLKQTDPTKQLNWLLAELCGPTMAVQYLGGSEAIPELNERLSEEAKAHIWLTDGGRAGSRLEFRLDGGKALGTPWPPGLRRERFDPLRAEFEAARDEAVREIQAAGRVNDASRDRLIIATNKLLVTLEDVFPAAERHESSASLEYYAAKQYLRSLVAEVNRAIGTNDRLVFAGALRFQGNTILELLHCMYQSGLVFSPPKEGGERIYRDLVQSLRNVYINLPNVRPQAGGKQAGKK